MSPTNPPDGARETPDGAHDEWQRRQRATARGPGRPDSPSRRIDDSDPYGWSAARDGGIDYPPGPPGPPNEELRTDRPARAAWARPDERLREAGRRLRDPHRRRAVEGQQTGLDPSLQSDLPSWLQERGEGLVPINRLLSLSVAGFAALLGLAVVLGAYLQPDSYALVTFGVQVLFILSWTVTMRPAGPRIVMIISLVAAVAADLSAALPAHASLAPLGLIAVAAVGAGVVGQLLRRGPRERATDSLGSMLIVVIGVISFAMLIVLSRHVPGTPSIVACLVAAAVALVVARLTDIVLPSPRTSPQVPRGSIGVVLGAMAGTVAAGVTGSLLVGLSPQRAVIAGLATALVAVLADLAVSYAEIGREFDGEAPALWVARHMQGPLGGLALAAPAAYVLSVMVLVTNLN